MPKRPIPTSDSHSIVGVFGALENPERFAVMVCGSVGIAGVIVGILARFVSLGTPSLAEDEYYLLSSVLFIMERGLPEFPHGGYYVRGLLQQYLTVPLLWLGGGPEWSIRLVPALSSLLALPPLFLIARRLGGIPVAALAVAFFSLSIWQIEFARFGRMYMPFQALYLWQCYLLMRVSLDGRVQDWKVMLSLSVVGILVSEAVIFLWILAVIPLLRGDVRPSFPRMGVSAAILGILFLWQTTNFRLMGQPSPLPPELAGQVSQGERSFLDRLPVLLPEFPLDLSAGFASWLLIGAVFLLLCWVGTRACRSSREPTELVGVGATVVMAAAGMFGVLAFLLTAWWLLKGTIPKFLRPEGRGLLTWALLALAGLLWGGALLLAGLGPYDVAKALLAYPPLNQAILQQWLLPMPAMTILLVVAMLTRVVVGLRESGLTPAWRLLAGSAVVMAFAVAVLQTGQEASRYTFFLYPIALLFLAEAIWAVPGPYLRKATLRTAVPVAAFVGVLLASEDFSASHLRNITTPEVMYRIGMSPQVWRHLVPRDDFREPAEFINARLEDGDTVVFGPPTAPLYLARVDYSYELHPSIRFFDVSVYEGTMEVWTGASLLWREDDLYSVLCEASGEVWLLLHADPRGIRSARDAAVRDSLAPWKVFTNFGETAEVFRVSPPEWRLEERC